MAIEEKIAKMFGKEFIVLSPKISELAEIIWLTFRMGGSVPRDVVTARFSDSKDIDNLVATGILEMHADPQGRSPQLVLSDSFENAILRKDMGEINSNWILETLISSYSDKLVERYNIGPLLNSLSAVLSAVIRQAGPQKPAFLGKIIKSGGLESFEKTRTLLDYYLCRYLGLVKIDDGYAVNLSDKAVNLLQKDAELANVYSGKKEK